MLSLFFDLVLSDLTFTLFQGCDLDLDLTLTLQEMTMLTQQILQQALIKKKLEEQKENYRKKQEGKPVRL